MASHLQYIIRKGAIMFGLFKKYVDIENFDNDTKSLATKILSDAIDGNKALGSSQKEKDFTNFLMNQRNLIVFIAKRYAKNMLTISNHDPYKLTKNEYLNLITISLDFTFSLLERELNLEPCSFAEIIFKLEMLLNRELEEFEELKQNPFVEDETRTIAARYIKLLGIIVYGLQDIAA